MSQQPLEEEKGEVKKKSKAARRDNKDVVMIDTSVKKESEKE